MSGLLVDHSKKGPLSFSSAEFYCVLNLETQKMIIKKEQNKEDNHKSNTVINLEKVCKVEPEASLPKYNKDSAFQITVNSAA